MFSLTNSEVLFLSIKFEFSKSSLLAQLPFEEKLKISVAESILQNSKEFIAVVKLLNSFTGETLVVESTCNKFLSFSKDRSYRET